MEALRGQGAYGAVYRAVRVGREHSGPVALKLSVLPWDRRFAREAQLLSRLSHPGLPRLLDSGSLIPPSGFEHPFVVMEWVEGTRLYAWAEQHAPAGWEVCEGAERLTWRSLAPFTPGYLSPQACRFDVSLARNPDGYYPPSPADDLYALGVTAYRLVMGDYPPPMDARRDEEGSWLLSSRDPRPLLERNPRVEPRLREFILRLLAEAPEERGTASQAAEVLEAIAHEHMSQRPAESQPAAEVSPATVPAPASESERPQPVRPAARAWTWEPWLALAAVGVCALLLWTVLPAPFPPGYVASGPRQSSDSQAPDAGTATVGEDAPAEPQASAPPSAEQQPLAQQPLPEPRPGQARPDEKGRCPGPRQVPINGGCWGEMLQLSAKECAENGYVPFKGKCYTPAFPPPKKPQPTSDPSRK